MLKKCYKQILGLLFAVTMFVGAGCAFIAQMDKDLLAAYVVEAIADQDAEALWEVTSPAAQEELLKLADNDLAEAKKGWLKLLTLAVEVGQDASPEELKNNDSLQEKIAKNLASKDDVFVEIDGKWYLGSK